MVESKIYAISDVAAKPDFTYHAIILEKKMLFNSAFGI